MLIEVYADESGTHDPTGRQPGSEAAIVAGFAATMDDWKPFCIDWQRILTGYRAPYFHFRQWRDAEVVARTNRKPSKDFDRNPYRDWSLEKLKAFAVELAKVAGSGNKLIVKNPVDTKTIYESKLKGNNTGIDDPYKWCVKGFFRHYSSIVGTERAPWKRMPVKFIFDDPPPKEKQWRGAIVDAYEDYRGEHPRTTFAFGNKLDPQMLPLQAADMLAYRTRFIAGKWIGEETSGAWKELDIPLFKPLFAYMERHKAEVIREYLSGGYRYDPRRRPK